MIKVLVADDSALMRKLLEGIFHEQGDFEVRTARNGDEAGLHSSKVSGRSSAGVRETTSPSAFLKVTRPIWNS